MSVLRCQFWPLFSVIYIRWLCLKEHCMELCECNELKSTSSCRKIDANQYLLLHSFFLHIVSRAAVVCFAMDPKKTYALYTIKK